MNTATTSPKKPTARAKALPAKKLPKGPPKPGHLRVSDDPLTELRRLTREHATFTRVAISEENSTRDKRDRKTGKVLSPCPFTPELVAHKLALAKYSAAEAKKLEPLMTAELKKLPAWNLFLGKVFGVGPVIGSYLLTMFDAHDNPNTGRMRTASQWMLWAGNVPGKNRRKAGEKSKFNADLKVRLWQCLMGMMKSGKRYGKVNKYLLAWAGRHHRAIQQGKPFMKARDCGRMLATELLIRDLYYVCRAVAGLPVRIEYVEAKLGVRHGTMPPRFDVPYEWTVEEALKEVSGLAPEGFMDRKVRADDLVPWKTGEEESEDETEESHVIE